MIFTDRCIPEYIERNGANDVLEIMNSLGGFPMYEGDSWNPLRLNKSKILEDHSLIIFKFLKFGFKIQNIDLESPLYEITVSEYFLFRLKFLRAKDYLLKIYILDSF